MLKNKNNGGKFNITNNNIAPILLCSLWLLKVCKTFQAIYIGVPFKRHPIIQKKKILNGILLFEGQLEYQIVYTNDISTVFCMALVEVILWIEIIINYFVLK